MSTELVQGSPQTLKERVDAIIVADTPTSLQVITLAEKSWYLIIWD
jgi:hypothetical protein